MPRQADEGAFSSEEGAGSERDGAFEECPSCETIHGLSGSRLIYIWSGQGSQEQEGHEAGCGLSPAGARYRQLPYTPYTILLSVRMQCDISCIYHHPPRPRRITILTLDVQFQIIFASPRDKTRISSLQLALTWRGGLRFGRWQDDRQDPAGIRHINLRRHTSMMRCIRPRQICSHQK